MNTPWCTYNLGFYVTQKLLDDDIYGNVFGIGGRSVKKTKAPRDKRTKAQLLGDIEYLQARAKTLSEQIDSLRRLANGLEHRLTAESKLRESCATLSDALIHMLRAHEL